MREYRVQHGLFFCKLNCVCSVLLSPFGLELRGNRAECAFSFLAMMHADLNIPMTGEKDDPQN
jgi:hypothetical protein